MQQFSRESVTGTDLLSRDKGMLVWDFVPPGVPRGRALLCLYG